MKLGCVLISRMMNFVCVCRQEYSIYVAGLSEEVDDYAFYQCFIKKFPSTVSAKGRAQIQLIETDAQKTLP